VHAYNIIPKADVLESCDLFKFWEISDNISLTVHGRYTVAMEDP